MPYEYKVRRRVEFSETDMAGIVHYSNFFRYMEAAEHEFFRSLGFSVVARQVDPPVGSPRVRAECDYQHPLRFEDEFEVHMLVTEKKSKSLSYQFRIRKLNTQPSVEWCGRAHRGMRDASGRHHEGGRDSAGDCGQDRSCPC